MGVLGFAWFVEVLEESRQLMFADFFV